MTTAQRYPTIVVRWTNDGAPAVLTLRNRTIKEATERAISFGYCPPKWYLPWQYLTHKLTIQFAK